MQERSRLQQASQGSVFDYETQEWVSGQAAVNLRREQLLKELSNLEGPMGAEYMRFLNLNGSHAEAVSACRKAVADLESDNSATGCVSP